MARRGGLPAEPFAVGELRARPRERLPRQACGKSGVEKRPSLCLVLARQEGPGQAQAVVQGRQTCGFRGCVS
ncbi:hypothetical protein Misp03_15340 [Microbispora sp. NBRC 16548]|nr:hypothetical protein Misp03_15340 [Microbispora sp. NBRC 16548]